MSSKRSKPGVRAPQRIKEVRSAPAPDQIPTINAPYTLEKCLDTTLKVWRARRDTDGRPVVVVLTHVEQWKWSHKAPKELLQDRLPHVPPVLEATEGWIVYDLPTQVTGLLTTRLEADEAQLATLLYRIALGTQHAADIAIQRAPAESWRPGRDDHIHPSTWTGHHILIDDALNPWVVAHGLGLPPDAPFESRPWWCGLNRGNPLTPELRSMALLIHWLKTGQWPTASAMVYVTELFEDEGTPQTIGPLVHRAMPEILWHGGQSLMWDPKTDRSALEHMALTPKDTTWLLKLHAASFEDSPLIAGLDTMDASALVTWLRQRAHDHDMEAATTLLLARDDLHTLPGVCDYLWDHFEGALMWPLEAGLPIPTTMAHVLKAHAPAKTRVTALATASDTGDESRRNALHILRRPLPTQTSGPERSLNAEACFHEPPPADMTRNERRGMYFDMAQDVPFHIGSDSAQSHLVHKSLHPHHATLNPYAPDKIEVLAVDGPVAAESVPVQRLSMARVGHVTLGPMTLEADEEQPVLVARVPPTAPAYQADENHQTEDESATELAGDPPPVAQNATVWSRLKDILMPWTKP